ncbi:unknown [Bacteroides sp. CAG:633]|nr:unknown [Bacteroides sp. CAG:633]
MTRIFTDWIFKFRKCELKPNNLPEGGESDTTSGMKNKKMKNEDYTSM